MTISERDSGMLYGAASGGCSGCPDANPQRQPRRWSDLPELLAPEDLAPLLRLTPHGVRAMIRRGELPACKLGRRWFVRRTALEAHIRRQERLRARVPEPGSVTRLLRALPPPRRKRSRPS